MPLAKRISERTFRANICRSNVIKSHRKFRSLFAAYLNFVSVAIIRRDNLMEMLQIEVESASGMFFFQLVKQTDV